MRRSFIVFIPVASVAMAICQLGCGAKSQLSVEGDDAAMDATPPPVTDSARPDRTPPPIDTGTPRMSCVAPDSFAFMEGEVAGEILNFEFGFSGGIRDMGKCGPDWVLLFTNQPCVTMGEVPIPSVLITITGPPLFTSGIAYAGEATFVTEGGVALFPVEVMAEELSEPDRGGRARGFVFGEDFLFGEFDLPMDPNLVDVPFCA